MPCRGWQNRAVGAGRPPPGTRRGARLVALAAPRSPHPRDHVPRPAPGPCRDPGTGADGDRDLGPAGCRRGGPGRVGAAGLGRLPRLLPRRRLHLPGARGARALPREPRDRARRAPHARRHAPGMVRDRGRAAQPHLRRAADPGRAGARDSAVLAGSHDARGHPAGRARAVPLLLPHAAAAPVHGLVGGGAERAPAADRGVRGRQRLRPPPAGRRDARPIPLRRRHRRRAPVLREGRPGPGRRRRRRARAVLRAAPAAAARPRWWPGGGSGPP